MSEFNYEQFHEEVMASLRREIMHSTLHAVENRSGNVEVRAAIEDGTIKKYLCPVMKSLSGDLFEITKVGIPILVSLSLAGAISISLNPVLFAGVFIVIARMGVAAYCADCSEKES